MARAVLVVAAPAVLVAVSMVPAAAQPVPDRTLVVGTKEAAPFAMKRPDGDWTGISIDLWALVAGRLGYEFELRETDLAGLLAGIEDGSLDAGVAAITMTPEREAVMDFTHPFHVSGLGIAVERGGRRGWFAVLEQFLSLEFLRIVGGLAVLLFVVGWLVWIFERRANPGQFGGTPAEGIGASFWWSAVTMTTVGYGDKAPQTVGGRVVALLWMFAALVVISSFTASIAASLTVGSIEGAISGPEELHAVRISTVPASTSSAYLESRQLPFTPAPTPADALAALARGDADAVVYDAPILQYDVRQQFNASLVVLPARFERQLYAIALPTDSPLREPLNRVLLEYTASNDWIRLLESYLGGTQ